MGLRVIMISTAVRGFDAGVICPQRIGIAEAERESDGSLKKQSDKKHARPTHL